jgi:hypothetical protein
MQSSRRASIAKGQSQSRIYSSTQESILAVEDVLNFELPTVAATVRQGAKLPVGATEQPENMPDTC